MKILNLYAGGGGNSLLWNDHDVTAIELDASIAEVYKHYHPGHKVVVTDAHQYLLNHYNDFDFIWSSRPCITHSRANFWASKTAYNRKKYYPDMGLYEEILFLKHWFAGKWVVENVIPYYDFLIQPDTKIGRHVYWSNFYISETETPNENIFAGKRNDWRDLHGIDLSDFKLSKRKGQVYRNIVHPETGLHILNCALNMPTIKQTELF